MASADTIHLYAAGSLREALTDVVDAFVADTRHKVETKYGPSGLLKDEIANGATAGVFASANMEHPRALERLKKSGPVICFARNTLCALVRPGLNVTSENLLDRMLDPAIALGTSTPIADPSGDYAFVVFARTEMIMRGARDTLERKALQLTGATTSAAAPRGRNVYGWHIAEGHADIFLTYCTNALAATRQYPGQQSVRLPDALAVAADYGLTVIKGAPAAARAFAQFMLSHQAQDILARHGFAPA
ncbi:MAG TPA: molybdate ABC transporter substrate-binding protein [Pseudolabrys sp.]|jgi:molybdenum ABC transporter molybdate-binding protein|nr:molybdate ABC transporter substrate-binding protein [Pseudolabrys sp.]